MSAFLCASAARADSTWLQPESFAATPGASLWVMANSNAEFADSQTPLQRSRIVRISGMLGGEAIAFAPPSAPATLARYAMTLPRPGVALLVAELQPERKEIPAEDVETYLRGIHATDELRQAQEKMPANAPWREQRNVRLKAWVRVGVPSASEHPWTQPVAGGGLDLVVDDDPTALSEDGFVTVHALRNGTALPDCVISFMSRGETREHVAMTNQDGRVRARLDAKGPWLIQGGTWHRVSAPDHEWESDIVMLTLDAK